MNFPTLSANRRIQLLLPLLILALAGTLLSPGYILSLDLVWTPEMRFVWNENGFNNSAPISILISLLSTVIPAWLVQKGYLLALLSTLVLIPWRFLPFIKGREARLFAMLVFVSNPFVYTRFLSGQWGHLFGYALLPLLLHSLVRLVESPSIRSAARWTLSLFLISLFSIHFLYLSLVFSSIWIGAHLLRFGKEWRTGFRLARSSGAGFLLFVCFSLFWIIPALSRSSPLEARFDAAHFSAFAAASYNTIPVLLNTAVGGGFWVEGTGWASAFFWPQDFAFFWIAASLIFTVSLFGAFLAFRRPSREWLPFLLLFAFGAFAFVAALGAAETPFRNINLFLYEFLPGWQGLRDSQKIAGFLILSLAVFSGRGVARIFEFLRARHAVLVPVARASLLSLPVAFGIFLWGGVAGQLLPAWYPPEWNEARALLDRDPSARILVLPWHGYLSLSFVGNRVVANPAERFFGRNRTIQSRSVEQGVVRDQEIDPAYRTLDTLISNLPDLPPNERSNRLRGAGFTHILLIGNSQIPASSDGIFSWDPGKIDAALPPSRFYKNTPPLSDAFDGTVLLETNSIQLLHLLDT